MPPTYPKELKKLNVIAHLEELRMRILFSLAIFLALAFVFFFKSDVLMRAAVSPIEDLVPNLIFISPTESIVAYFKISFLASFICSFLVAAYQLWAFISPAFEKQKRVHIVLWTISSILLFFAGTAFSYWVALPVGLKFLINFGRDMLVPQITIGEYTSFFCAIIVIGGIIFEIPVIIGLFADIGILSPAMLRKNRKYVLLGILIFAAIITPTQDVVNLLIFSLPMFLLYEVGIMLAALLYENNNHYDQGVES
ncbi:MAG: twin-arginine translocase subunit TatC [Candidatus Omnitrophica bacterium]|nr:twin-arginine translocase subunit TatC [Candidatus Omnitrophota bacterium]